MMTKARTQISSNKFKLTILGTICLLLFINFFAHAGPRGFNYDESKVSDYKLIDPRAGITEASEWPQKRIEFLKVIEEQMFGKAPEFDKSKLKITGDKKGKLILGGKAILTQPSLHFANIKLPLLIIMVMQNKCVITRVLFLILGQHI